MGIWRASDKPKTPGPAIPKSRIVRLRRKPSAFPFNFCEINDCGSYVDVYYDPELRKHACSKCWSDTARPQPAAYVAEEKSDNSDNAWET